MKKAALLFAVCFLLMGVVGVSHAATYKYTDKDGGIGFADDLQSVPEPYRAKAILIEGELKEEPVRPSASAAKTSAQQAPPAASASRHQAVSAAAPVTAVAPAAHSPWTFSTRLMTTTVVGVALIVLFILLTRPRVLERHGQLRTVIRAALAAIFLLYLVLVHGNDIMLVFGLAGKAVNQVQQQSALKGRKAGEAIKKLDAIVEELQKTEETLKKEEDAANSK